MENNKDHIAKVYVLLEAIAQSRAKYIEILTYRDWETDRKSVV